MRYPWRRSAMASGFCRISLGIGTSGTNPCLVVWRLRAADLTESYDREVNGAKPMIDPSSRIYIPGHTGLVGSALVRTLERSGYQNLFLRHHRDLELPNQTA